MTGSLTDVDAVASARLAALDQRYTRGRRAIVAVLSGAGRPLTGPEILGGAQRGALPQSSAYRSLAVLEEAAVVHRLPGTDEFARYELAEDLAGHHHHLLCSTCGRVDDVPASPRLERALAAAAQAVADGTDFHVTGHRIDLLGTCAACR